MAGAGANIGVDQMNNIISSLTINLRNVMRQISDLSISVNGGGAGLAYLTSLGYSNTIATSNPNNPVVSGTMLTDAALALSAIAYLNTVALVYFGALQQGGSGGTGASLFNFNQQLAMFWAGQVV
jgi:hypothetical protein